MKSADLHAIAARGGWLCPSEIRAVADRMARLERDEARMRTALDRLVADTQAEAEDAEAAAHQRAAALADACQAGRVVPLLRALMGRPAR